MYRVLQLRSHDEGRWVNEGIRNKVESLDLGKILLWFITAKIGIAAHVLLEPYMPFCKFRFILDIRLAFCCHLIVMLVYICTQALLELNENII